jgi:hypothetical protein
MKNVIFTLLLFLGLKATAQQTVNLNYANPVINGTKFRATLQISSGTQSFFCGATNFRVVYNNSALSNPILISDEFQSPEFGPTNSTGSGALSSQPGFSQFSLNTPLSISGSQVFLVTSTPRNVAVIEWDIVNAQDSARLGHRGMGVVTPNPRNAITPVPGTPALVQGAFTPATFALTVPSFSATIAKINPTCNGGTNGSATANTSLGTSPFTYLWSNGQTTQTATDLAAGNYSVTVTDANNAKASASTTLTQPSAVTGGVQSINPTCATASNGSVTISPSGGTGPYTIVPAQTGLAAGTYTFTITDNNGCTGTVQATLTAPPALSAIASATNVTCFGGSNGSVTVTPSGGTAPYQIAGNTQGLVAGSYTFTVTDNNGCTTTASATVTEPTALTAIATATNVSCFGGTNGSVTVVPSGGTAPYQITGATSGLVAGTYVYTITDTNGCTTTASATVTQPSAVFGTTQATNATCTAANGSVTIVPSGGTGPYQITGATTGLAAGSYTFTITDTNGCTGTVQATVGSDASTVTATTTVTNVSCNGGSNGSVAVTPSGGIAPYTIVPSQTGLTAGSYTFTVTDANGCTATASATITQPSPLTASVTATTDANCGQNNGTATVTPAGGTAPYTIMPAQTGLAAGSYTFTVTDTNGCTTTTTAQINASSGLSATTIVTNVSCFGGSNGSVEVTPSGGTGPYQIAGTTSGLVAGTYTFTITDVTGCSTTTSATVTAPAALSASASATNVTCNGGTNGSVVVTPSGGTAPYQIAGITTGLAAGTYTYTVTDNNGCTTTATATVTEPMALTALATATNVSCFGGANGSVVVAPSGGTTPYQIAGITTGLAAGTYTYTVTDNNGCTTTASATVTEPMVLTATVTSQINVNCPGGNDGSVVITPTGGTPNYTITPAQTGLTAGTYNFVVTDAKGCTASASATITTLSAGVTANAGADVTVSCLNPSATLTATGGTTYLWNTGETTASITVTPTQTTTYTVTATDANGCSGSDAVVVTVDTGINGSAGADATITCLVTSATLTATGGISYLWNNGETTASITVSPTITTTYSVTITGANGCTLVDAADVVVNTAPPAANAGADVTTNCTTPSATLTATGGVSYVWSNGATTAAITVNPSTTTSYFVAVTGTNGCLANDTVKVTVDKALPIANAGLDVTINVTNPSATLTATGGVSYVWNTGATTASITVSPTNTTNYIVTVTGANGCTASDPVLVTVEKRYNLAFVNPTITGNKFRVAIRMSADQGTTFSIGSNNLRFNYSTATLSNPTLVSEVFPSPAFSATNSTGSSTVTGVLSFNTAYSGPTNADILPITPTGVDLAIIEFTIVNPLGMGELTWRVTGAQPRLAVVDDDKVTACTPGMISNLVYPLGPLTITGTNQTNANCAGAATGLASVTAGGGFQPLSYLWSNGATSAAISNLSAGTYTVTVSDAQNSSQTASVTITEPAALGISIVGQTNVSCNGSSDGSVSLSTTGGTGSVVITPTQTGLAAGTYTFTATDANGCTATTTVTITQPAALSASSTVTDVSCFGGSNGSVGVTSVGGTAPYTVTPAQTGLTAGTYTFTITDVNGCSTTTTATVAQPTAVLSANITQQVNVSCFGGSNGSVVVTSVGGTAPYTVTPAQTGLTAGNYIFVVSDLKGCTASTSATITEPAVLTATISNQVNVTCFGGTNGSVTITPTGGIMPYTITPAQTGLAAGTYTFTVSDGNNCTVTVPVTILDGAQQSADAGADVTINCINPSTTLTATGGVSYVWSNGQTSASFSTLVGGTFTVTVTGANGCTATDAVVVTEDKAAPAANAGADRVLTCANPTATLTATGGTLYSWSTNETTASITVSTPNTYTVTVTGANGCTATDDVTVTENKTAPNANAGNDVTINCITPSTTLVATGGVSYAWSGGASQGGTVTPAVTTRYFVTVTGANGCTATDDVTVTVDKAAPLANAGFDVTVTATNPTATLTATGGVNYVWNTGATTASINVTPTITSTYVVTVTGANGCSASDAVRVVVEKKYSLSFVNPQITGNKFRFTIRMSSVTPFAIGNNNLRFNFDRNALSAPAVISDNFPSPSFGPTTTTGSNPTNGLISLNTSYSGPNNASPIQITSAGTDLVTMEFTITNPAGSSNLVWRTSGAVPNTVVVIDDKTTIAIPDVISNLNVPFTPLTVVNTSKTDVLCKGGATGTASVTTNGGLAPLTYLWSNGATTQNITNLVAGTYTVTVSDAYINVVNASVTITEPATVVDYTSNVTNILCFGANTGAIDLTPSGGTSPYSYAWSNGTTTEDLANLLAGSYSITVSDANGCTASGSISVTQNPLFTTNAGDDVTVNCINTSATLNAVGGVSFTWDNGATQGESVAPTSTTTYTVIATDANGCTASDAVTVVVDNTPPAANAGADQNLDCNTTDYILTATGGVSYLWDNGETTASITVTPTASTTYYVTVTGANGCTAEDEVAIVDNLAPVIDIASVPANVTVSCENAGSIPSIDDVADDVSVTGDCNVNIIAEEVTVQGNCANRYVITRTWTASDATGNSAQATQVITVVDNTAPSFTNAASVPASGATYLEITPSPVTLTATDNCGLAPVTFAETIVKLPLESGCQSYNNQVTRTWTATDACGNTATVTQQFIEKGTIELRCPADLTLNTNSDGINNYNCATLVLASQPVRPNFADLCDVSSILKFNVSGATTAIGSGSIAGLSLNSGVNNVSYIVEVAQNVFKTCTFKVSVIDNELPRFTPATLSPVVYDACTFPALPTSLPATAFGDNCSGATLSVDNVTTATTVAGCATKTPALKYFQSQTITWRVTDGAGNTRTAAQIYYLRDMVAPTARCKNVTVTIGNTNIAFNASSLNNGSTDNCTAPNALSYAICNGATCTNFTTALTLTKAMIPVGASQVILNVRLRVTDACGNASICNATITLKRAPGTLANNDNNEGIIVNDIDNASVVEANTPVEPSTVVTGHGSMKCFPNPFSEDLNVDYNLTADEAQVVLKVYDNQGRIVRILEQGSQLAGYYNVRWNLSDLDSGMYHVCLEFGGKCQKVERVVMMK